GAYNKIKWDSVEYLGVLKPRAALLQAAALFYDAGMTDWLVKETAVAPDAASKLLPIETAIKVMPPNKADAVSAAMQKAKGDIPGDVFQASRQMFDFAKQVLDKCKTETSCYLGVLDEPIPSTPTTANWRDIKSAYMTVVFGEANADQTRGELLKRIGKVKDPSARLAIVEAIDELAPHGDVKAADALDKMVASDTKSGDKAVLMADDSVVKTALRLRARAN
ncbi:MAG: hypothetical protein FWD17_02045, partial [Polyangiaceae bacterium]|nr:hypothetical protein [Polyangiaceae bacterium]